MTTDLGLRSTSDFVLVLCCLLLAHADGTRANLVLGEQTTKVDLDRKLDHAS